MQRREFLVESGRAGLGLSALYVSGCSAGHKDVFLESLAAGWEAGIPQWLKEAKMPAVSIAIIRDGKLAWRRAFGVTRCSICQKIFLKSRGKDCAGRTSSTISATMRRLI